MRHWGWLRLARELHMSVDEVVEKHTVRQYKLWMEYLDEHPSEVMEYLMQLTAEVRLSNPNAKGQVTRGQFKLVREIIRESQPDDRSADEVSREAAKDWIEALGGNVTIVRKPRDTDETQ